MDLRDFYRRYLERCNDHRFDELGSFVAPDVRVNDVLTGVEGYAAGLAGVVAVADGRIVAVWGDLERERLAVAESSSG